MIADLFVLCCLVVVLVGLFMACDVVLSVFWDEDMRRRGSRRLKCGSYVKGGCVSMAPQRATRTHPKQSER